jgi:hypothetical protein
MYLIRYHSGSDSLIGGIELLVVLFLILVLATTTRR